jgi:hypothetical protein
VGVTDFQARPEDGFAAVLDEVAAVADAVLFEGYLLYPYRASARKNQLRWQFGVLAPPAYAERDGSEHSDMRTECLLEPGDAATLEVAVRFLRVRARTVQEAVGGPRRLAFRPVSSLEVDGAPLTAWDEGEPTEVTACLDLTQLPVRREVSIELPGGQSSEQLHDAEGRLVGRAVWAWTPLRGALRLAAEPLPGPYGIVRLRVEIANTTGCAASAGREEALRHSFVATHTLLGVTDARFISLLDPPEWARPAVESCQNVRTWPVLVGEGRRDVMLSSPIVLYDYPSVAPESPGDLFDATEIDEILTLRTAALTDDEKREARATDRRAAAIIDRVDGMPAEIMERLHGSVRYLRDVTGQPLGRPAPDPDPLRPAPWWDPGSDASVSPHTDELTIGGRRVARGGRVRLHPGLRRADAQDMFLDGRVATVEAVFFDVDEASYLAVMLADDPAADLHQWHGRFLYFSPDEVEVLE